VIDVAMAALNGKITTQGAVNLAYGSKISLNEIINQLKSQNVDMTKVHRIQAHYTPGNGHYGCAKSHLDALKYASKKGYDTILVFEDDFKFSVKAEKTKELFNNLFRKVPKSEWNIVILAYTSGQVKDSPYSFLNKVTEAQSSTGYIIQKKYYPILINTFQKCIDNMLSEKTTGFNSEKWAIDQIWKENQKQDNWFSFNPLIGEHNYEIDSTIGEITNYN
jgi:GR25 family glycosyltransferase involved in LPS biosynthesis